MRKVIKLAVAGFFWSASISATLADTTLPPPKAAYDATVTIDYGDSHTVSTVNADGPKERRTAALVAGGQPQTIIVRRDEDKIYLLIPALNAAMTVGSTEVPGFNLDDLDTLPVEAQGTDKIDGMTATRYHAAAATKQGAFDGLIWMTGNGIPLQIEGTVTHKDKVTPVKITTSDLHIRAQAAQLFEIPSGMKVMPAGMAGLLSGVKAPKGTP
jgi:hypothetical protein